MRLIALLRWLYHAAARTYWQTVMVNQRAAGVLDENVIDRYWNHLGDELAAERRARRP